MDAYIRMTLYDPSTGNTEAFRTTTQVPSEALFSACSRAQVGAQY